MLIVFGGLPATGKSTLSRHLARALSAVHLRIDTIEQALRDGGATVEGPEGYLVAYVLAADNLRLGNRVIADSVNPIAVTREAWRDVARRCGTRCVEVHVVCSDREEHRRRVSERQTDVPGLVLPTWEQVCAREIEPWDADIVLDTAGRTIASCVEELLLAW